MKVLSLCGSLRARSSNRAMIRAYEALAPSDFVFTHYEELASLSHFNPDADNEPLPPEVVRLRALIAESDVLLISTPEYAHGLPGSFKNALDWLVSDSSIVGKIIVILHASRGSTWAIDSLREILRTMSTQLIEAATALLPLGSNQIDTEAILRREDLRELLSDSISALQHATTRRKSNSGNL